MEAVKELGFGRAGTGTDRFVIRRRIGEGGMGVVYEAHDRERDERVALKTLRTLDAHALYRFKREFRALQDLEHPNLVNLGELHEVDGQWFFTMELIEGVDFMSYVRPTGESGRPELDAPRLRAALRQLADGLVTLHSAGKVHRDVKPSNIRVDGDGRVVLLDFGVIADSEMDRTTGDRVVGTAHYMAPEQALGKDITPAADWYAFGSVMYEALTGRLPYYGATAVDVLLSKRTKRATPPRHHALEAPADLCALCEQLLEADPPQRPTQTRILALLGAYDGSGRVAHKRPRARTAEPRPLLGRDREFGQLAAALTAVTSGQPVAVLVRGESGIGKTALVKAYADGLDDPSVVVLSGRCYERELVPYKAFDGVIDALARHMRQLPAEAAAALVPRNAALLPAAFPALRRVAALTDAPRPRPSRDAVELRERVFTALRELFFRFAERNTVVVTIDDLQWADADSLLLLGDLLRPPDAPPMLVIATARPGAALGLELQVIDIGPLGADAGAALATRLLAEAGVEGDPSSIAAEAGGHPLFIAELAQHAADRGSASTPHPRLDEAIWTRALRLPDQALLVLELITVADAPIAHEVVRIAADIDAPEFARRISSLRIAHLVKSQGSQPWDPVEPYHDRVREAVWNGLDREQRAALHARLVTGLEQAGKADERPDLMVRHLEAAGRSRDAATRAAEAGDRAMEGVALERAAQLYRTALRLGDYSGDERRQLQLRLAAALTNAGHGEAAAEAYLAAAEGADDNVRLDCQAWASNQLLISGHYERGMQITHELLAEVGGRIPRSPIGAAWGVVWRRLWLRVRGYRWRERDAATIDPRELNRLDAYRATGEGLATIDPIRGAYFQARSMLLALRVGEWTRVSRLLGLEVVFLAAQSRRGNVVRLLDIVDQLKRIYRDKQDTYVRIGALTAEGMIEFFSGRFRAAAELLGRAESQLSEMPSIPALDLNNIRLLRLIALRQAGSFAEGWRLMEDYVRDAVRRGDRFAETSLRRTSTVLWLAHDQPEQALANLDGTTWSPPTTSFHVQHWYDIDGRATIALYQGRVPEAMAELAPGFRSMSRSLLQRITQLRHTSRWLRGRLALAMAEAPACEPTVRRRELALARKLSRKLEREGVPQALAMAQLLRAGIANIAGDATRASALLAEAVRNAESGDMLLVAHTARLCRGILIGGDDGIGLVHSAHAWMEREGVVAPLRFTRIVTPGFNLGR